MGDVRCDIDSAYDTLDGRMLLAFTSQGGVDFLPPKRSYLWRLLRRCWRGNIVAIATPLIDEPPGAVETVAGLSQAIADAAGTIVAARVYRARMPSDARPGAANHNVVAERIGIVYGRDAIINFVTLADVIAAAMCFDIRAPEGWTLDEPRRVRSGANASGG